MADTVISKIFSYLKNKEENKGEVDTNFGERILAIAEEEKMVVKKSAFKKWAPLVYDFNRIHLFEEYAKEMGFETTPVYGTLIAARVEQYVLSLLEEINKMNRKKLVYAGQKVSFKRPLYPKVRASWNLIDVVEDDSSINLNINAVDQKDKVIVACPETNLRESLYASQETDINAFFDGKILASNKLEIKKEELDLFYSCLRRKPKENIPMMYPASFIIAALLELSSRKSGRPQGGYSGLDLKFYNPPLLGKPFETLVSMKEPPEQRRNFYHYNFEVLCIQDKKAILGGTIKCYSPEEFKV